MEKRNEGAIISSRPSTAHVAYVQVPRALPLPDGILAKLGGEHNRLERGVGLPEGDAFFENWNDASLVPRHSHVPIWMPDPNLESECEKQLQEGHGNVW